MAGQVIQYLRFPAGVILVLAFCGRHHPDKLTIATALIEPPTRLRKRFPEARFADAFASDGAIRLRRLEFYRTIEDVGRRDSDEGKGRLRVPGRLPVMNYSLVDRTITDGEPVDGHFNYGIEWVMPTYVFCTADASADPADLSDRFGREVVEIVDPQAFFRALCAGAANPKAPYPHDRELMFVEGLPVRYDKDHISDRPKDPEDQTRLAYAQKPEGYKADQEYRFVVVLSGASDDAPEWIDLSLDSPGRFLARYPGQAATTSP